uniref:Uncharacterized protein n=1 Tax=Knipowitschia caucasica TaxID=637954 RepID=A0AAV2M630_KNICA
MDIRTWLKKPNTTPAVFPQPGSSYRRTGEAEEHLPRPWQQVPRQMEESDSPAIPPVPTASDPGSAVFGAARPPSHSQQQLCLPEDLGVEKPQMPWRIQVRPVVMHSDEVQLASTAGTLQLPAPITIIITALDRVCLSQTITMTKQPRLRAKRTRTTLGFLMVSLRAEREEDGPVVSCAAFGLLNHGQEPGARSWMAIASHRPGHPGMSSAEDARRRPGASACVTRYKGRCLRVLKEAAAALLTEKSQQRSVFVERGVRPRAQLQQQQLFNPFSTGRSLWITKDS